MTPGNGLLTSRNHHVGGPFWRFRLLCVESVAEREQRIAELAERRALARRGGQVEQRAWTTETAAPLLLSRTLSGPPAGPRAAMSLPDVFACVRVLANAAASLPLHVYRQGDRGRVRADDTAAARLLRNPAPAITQSAFVGHLTTSLALFGEGFIGLMNDGDGQVGQLGIFAPDRVTVQTEGGMPLYGVTTDDGRYLVLDRQSIVHVRLPLSLDGVRGMSPITTLRESIGYASALQAHGSQFIAQGGRPSGVLYVQPGPNADEQMENLRAAWEARHSTAGRVALLSGDVKFEPISLPLADAQFLEQVDLSTAQVCRAFGVPPWMIAAKSGGDSLTYETVAENARWFVTFSLRPWLVAIEQALGGCERLFAPGQRTYPRFELDALLRADPKSRAEVYAAAIEHGWMDVDEVRELEDLPRRDRREATADA